MSGSMKALVLGAALVVGSAIAGGLPVQAADVSVGIGPGGIAFGFTDGYWDRDHHWHAWRNHEEMEHWRAANAGHFYAYNHEHDHDHGWHESDRYWDHH